MKTRVELYEEKTIDYKFPYWGIANNPSGDKRIVMFTSLREGWVFHDDIGELLGEFHKGFTIKDFKPFKGILTIKLD